MEKLGAGVATRRFRLGVEDGVTSLAGIFGRGGFFGCILRYFLERFVEVFNSKLFRFSQLLESPDGDDVGEPESCTGGVRHDVAALDLDRPSGVMEMNSNTAEASQVGHECEMY